MLGSLGVVYGDRNQPTLRVQGIASAAAGGGAITCATVFGIVSLILWALIVVVTIKTCSSSSGRTVTARVGRDADGARAGAMGHNVLVIALLGMGGRHVLRRCHHYAGDFRALGGGGISCHPRLRPLRTAADLLVPLGLVALQSHRTAPVAARFGPLQAVVRRHGGRRHPHRGRSEHPGGPQPNLRGVAFLGKPWHGGAFALGAVFLAVTGAEALMC